MLRCLKCCAGCRKGTAPNRQLNSCLQSVRDVRDRSQRKGHRWTWKTFAYSTPQTFCSGAALALAFGAVLDGKHGRPFDRPMIFANSCICRRPPTIHLFPLLCSEPRLSSALSSLPFPRSLKPSLVSATVSSSPVSLSLQQQRQFHANPKNKNANLAVTPAAVVSRLNERKTALRYAATPSKTATHAPSRSFLLISLSRCVLHSRSLHSTAVTKKNVNMGRYAFYWARNRARVVGLRDRGKWRMRRSGAIGRMWFEVWQTKSLARIRFLELNIAEFWWE